MSLVIDPSVSIAI